MKIAHFITFSKKRPHFFLLSPSRIPSGMSDAGYCALIEPLLSSWHVIETLQPAEGPSDPSVNWQGKQQLVCVPRSSCCPSPMPWDQFWARESSRKHICAGGWGKFSDRQNAVPKKMTTQASNATSQQQSTLQRTHNALIIKRIVGARED